MFELLGIINLVEPKIPEAIAEYRDEYDDERVFSLIHEQVTSGHPRISEQQLMADTLKEFIDTTPSCLKVSPIAIKIFTKSTKSIQTIVSPNSY